MGNRDERKKLSNEMMYETLVIVEKKIERTLFKSQSTIGYELERMIMLNNYSSKIIINTDHLSHYLTLQSLHKLYQLNKDFVASSKNNWN